MTPRAALVAEFDECILEADSIAEESQKLDSAHRIALEQVRQLRDGSTFRDLQRTYLKYRNDLGHRLALNAQRVERLCWELARH